ncbi:MAG: hypothetical protein EKK29_01325 [Hyphomicrobiales bacterium]|nr:MAG: hypothetical protein EKK29_01325 [Hyphomicrobiales bacterium]
MDDEGDGSAATKTVRLKAANALLDNPEARAPNVSVSINNGVQLSAGVVVALPPELAKIASERLEPNSIEPKAAPVIERRGSLRTSPVDYQQRYLLDDDNNDEAADD